MQYGSFSWASSRFVKESLEASVLLPLLNASTIRSPLQLLSGGLIHDQSEHIHNEPQKLSG
jgi:hypothetical protein